MVRSCQNWMWKCVVVCFISVLMLGNVEASEWSSVDGAMGKVADVLEAIVFVDFTVQGNALPVILVVLGVTAIFLTLYFRCINLRGFGLALRTVRGKYTDADAPGQITHFQALSAALSATVGLGNIAGVAIAIGIGGPGATFWMIVMGLLGMTTKFAECTLGVKYRKINKEGKTYGGAMYYLRDGLAERGLGGLGKVLAIFFAVMCIGGAIGAGNMYQVNQAATQFADSFGFFVGDQKIYFGVIVAVLVGLVIIGGIKSIARVTSFLVPFMCITYLIAALWIIVANMDLLPSAVSQIVTSAFSPMAVGGGVVGVLIQGIKRAAFSNEAGVGSAPIAHSAVKTRKPASEGMVALLEPFVDTVVVCTMTALVLVISNAWKVDAVAKGDQTRFYSAPAIEKTIPHKVSEGTALRIIETKKIHKGTQNEATFGKVWKNEEGGDLWVAMDDGIVPVKGIQKTSRAFETQFSWFPKVLAVAVILFALSTMISWSYYGEQAVQYLFGMDNKIAEISYKVLFCGFVVVGTFASIGNVVRISDAMFFAMVFPNMVGIYVLLPVIKKELKDYQQHVAEIDAEQKK